MTTARSSFSFGRFWPVYCNTLRRYRSAGIFYSLLGFVFLPLQYFLSIYRLNVNEGLYGVLGGPAHTYNLFSGVFFTGLVLVVSFVLAVNLFSFLHSKRAVDVYHALPVTRTELFLSVEAAGVTILWIGILVNFLLVSLIGLACGYGALVPAILLEAAAWMACSFVIFTITAFAAVNVGTVFDTWLCSLALNGAVSVIYLIAILMCDGFLYGFYDNSSMVLLRAYKLSPVSLIIGRQMMTFDRLGRGSDVWYFAENNQAVFIWLLIGLLVLALSVWVYQKRRSEAAESVGTFGPVQVFVRAAATYIGGYALGVLFASVFSIWNSFGISASIFAGALIVYLVFDVLLARNVKTILRAVPAACAFAFVVGGTALAITTGGFGFEKRVPQLESVRSVVIDYRGRFSEEASLTEGGVAFEDPATIAAVLALHQTQLEQHWEDEASEDEGSSYRGNWIRYHIIYQLSGGTRLEREYSTRPTEKLADALLELEQSPEYLEKFHPIFQLTADDLDELSLRAMTANDWEYCRLSKQQYGELLDALRADMKAQVKEELLSPSAPALGFLRLSFVNRLSSEISGKRVISTTEILVTDGFQNTLSALRRFGLDAALEADEEKIEKVYAGISDSLGYYGNAALYQTRSDTIADLSYEIFVDGKRAGEEMPFGSFFECSEEELEQLRPYLRSSLPSYVPMIVVAVQSEGSAEEELSGYYVCDFRELPEAIQNKVFTYGDATYSWWRIGEYYRSIGLEYEDWEDFGVTEDIEVAYPKTVQVG